MTDAGFFRGTSADQDNRFANKQKKLLKELNFSPILNTKLNMSKIDVDSMKPWIEKKIKDILEKDDELLSDSIFEHLAEKEPDGKNILVLITGFVDDGKASKFMEELWTKLIDLQDNSNGLAKPTAGGLIDTDPKPKGDYSEDIPKPDNLSGNVDHPSDAPVVKGSVDNDGHHGSDSSHSPTPPSRSVSKSPGNHRLDELTRGRQRRRPKDDDNSSKDGSKSPNPTGDRKSRSLSRSRSQSPSASRKPHDRPGDRRKSRSSSRSGRRRYSDSRSPSRSPRDRSRSPYGHYRGGSRSHSGGFRPRSRSPRGRRIYGFGRGSYRGLPSYSSYHDRRRPAMAPIRRRSPWARRRFSPRSPVRMRRSPYSPRRRRSPSPHRRFSRSRSPPMHMMGRNIVSPRHHNAHIAGHSDMLGGRPPHHDMHRQTVPTNKSPRSLDHRAYGDGHLARNSPAVANKILDLPSTSQALTVGQAGSPDTNSPSSRSSGRKKHKKDKKHRKHKKSKRHHSSSPDKKKKHRKHKKSKKHKSH